MPAPLLAQVHTVNLMVLMAGSPATVFPDHERRRSRRRADGRGVALALIESAPTEPRRWRVPRARLVARLLGSSELPLVLITAPPGYGKTVLLEQWADRDTRPFTWIALRAAHNDPDALVEAVAPGIDRERRCVVVLDDAHVLEGSAAFRALERVVTGLPGGAQLVLAGRHAPALQLGALRASAGVLELGAHELAMTASEATDVLHAAGLGPAASSASELVARTEGWPAALQLAAQALADTPDVHAAVEDFGGEDRFISDYVREEMLGRLSGAERDFVGATSVLDELTGPACDALLEMNGSGALLAQLADSTSLLIALDRVRERYRYHALVREHLRADLHRRDPRRAIRLHIRAARWAYAHGDHDEAMDHALLAHDAELAGSLLAGDALAFVAHGGNARLRPWLAGFTLEAVAAVPGLALVAALSHGLAGDGGAMRHWAAIAADGVSGASGDDAIAVGADLLLAGAVERDVRAMGRRAASANRRAAAGSPWRAYACFLEGTAAVLTADGGTARDRLIDGIQHGARGNPGIEALSAAQLALQRLEDDDLPDAHALATRARDRAAQLGVQDEPLMALVAAASALVAACRGLIDEARAALRRTEQLQAQLSFSPWLEAEVGVVAARAALRLGDLAMARALHARAEHPMGSVTDAPQLAKWLEQVAEALTGATIRGAVLDGWTLTTAELRVLALLPSHLSFRELGAQLLVSQNTVKTHARAVYRKLDASSRAEAVDRARMAGLLDDASAC